VEGLGQDPAWDSGLYSSAVRLINDGDVDMHLQLRRQEELLMDVKTSVSLDCVTMK